MKSWFWPPSTVTVVVLFMAGVLGFNELIGALGVAGQTQGLVLLIAAWLLFGLLGAKAQWDRGGNIGAGFVVTMLFGPLGLLVANYSGGRQCPFCKSRGLDRNATKCPKCGSAVAGGDL